MCFFRYDETGSVFRTATPRPGTSFPNSKVHFQAGAQEAGREIGSQRFSGRNKNHRIIVISTWWSSQWGLGVCLMITTGWPGCFWNESTLERERERTGGGGGLCAFILYISLYIYIYCIHNMKRVAAGWNIAVLLVTWFDDGEARAVRVKIFPFHDDGLYNIKRRREEVVGRPRRGGGGICLAQLVPVAAAAFSFFSYYKDACCREFEEKKKKFSFFFLDEWMTKPFDDVTRCNGPIKKSLAATITRPSFFL